MISIKEIDDISKVIVTNYKPDKILLFGSYASGNATESSDVDLMIISDNEKNIPRYRRGLKLRVLLSSFKIKKDILFYSNDEIKKWADVKNTFVYRVLNEGKVLYGR